MRTLVTGGAGFIGSNLVDRLVADGADVVVLDDLSTGYAEYINPAARLVEGDIADPESVGRAVAGCEVVFHLAAHRAVFRSVEHPLATDRANVGGTLTVLVASRDAGVRRVVAASSSSVYGGAEILPTPESAPLVPRSPYAVSKLAGEHYCRVFWELFGLETVSMRYFNVYGPRQRPDSQYAAVIPLFIHALQNAEAPEVHGDGRQSRHFAYISDVVDANLLAATAPAERCAGRAFNIAGGDTHDLLDLLRILESVIGTSVPPLHTEPRAGDVRNTFADVSAAREALGYEAAVSFEDGLETTVAWFSQRAQTEESVA
jgi:UDP-N-acetylglucosamine/UDP-N-acetyl-alpha-D-glucosaminouronate 4-epimerase